jgi:hypothetical protein
VEQRYARPQGLDRRRRRALAGRYDAVVYYTCAKADVGAKITLSFKEQQAMGEVAEANDPQLVGAEHDRVKREGESYMKAFRPLRLGDIKLEKGIGTLTLKASEIPGKRVMDVWAVTLTLKK